MNVQEFVKRRKRLMRMMGSDSVAILPSAQIQIRNRDAEYPFRQDSDFYYLTGFDEPEAVLVLIPGRRHAQSILFCRERDAEMEQWIGPRAGQEGAVETFLLDDAFPIADLGDILPGLLEDKERIYYTMGKSADFDHQLLEWLNTIKERVRTGVHAPAELIALEPFTHDLRLYKSPSEISKMRRAAKISAQAHIRAMEVCQPGISEAHLEAEILYEFRVRGAQASAYTPIVGGGENACILHYTDNSMPLKDGDLVLIDAGCELDNYASDITRTFPVNGTFTAAQKAIYEIVLKAQLAAIRQVKPGNHWNHPHNAALRTITKGLIDLGIIKSSLTKALREESYKRFFMHRTGHWLGMDVHDVGDYKVDKHWRVLEPGMVLTVEPGIYIPSGSKGVAKKWWGIGVRIEDDVLVTRTGNDVLSKDAPKSVKEIEKLMAAAWEYV